jgi:4a-hydroxytetrahydrobiopterin dehydratase
VRSLARRKCIPCHGGVAPLKRRASAALLRQLGGGWRIAHPRGDSAAPRLAKEFATRDFSQALAFVAKVGALADREGHHPDVEFGWGYVRLKIFTHAIGGLSDSDFILAAKIDRLARR